MLMFRRFFIACCFLLSACQSIEHRSEEVAKKPLKSIEEEKLRVTTLWQAKAGKGVGKRDPLLKLAADQQAFVTVDYQGNVYRLDAQGRKIWHVNLNKNISAGPAIYQDHVLIASSAGDIIDLNLADGSQRWEKLMSSEVIVAPVASDGMVFVRTLDGSLTALGLQNGRQLWRYDLSSPSLILRRAGEPALVDDNIVVGFAAGRLVNFQKIDGAIDWSRELTIPHGRSDVQRMIDLSSSPVIVNGMVYVVGYQGKVVGLLLQTGEILWERELSSVSGLTVADDKVIVSAANGEVWALDRTHGGTLWVQSDLLGRRLSRPAEQYQNIVVADEDGYLHWLSQETGEVVARLKVDKKGIEAPIIVNNHQLFVLGKSGKITALVAKDLGRSSVTQNS